MRNILKRIPGRKILRENGKSFSVIAAVFFTTTLFVMVFSTLFFVKDAAEEIMRKSAPMLSDATIHVTQEEYDRICANPRTAEVSRGIHSGRTMEPSGVGYIDIFNHEEQMARWMKVYPEKGRMPERGHEIVVSDQYLRERGLTYNEGMLIEITYFYIQEEEHIYTDTFTVTGFYKRSAGQLGHEIVVSDDFYKEECLRLEQSGINPKGYADTLAGVIFSSRMNIRKEASLLAMEEGIDLEEGQIILNDSSVFQSLGMDTWAAILIMVILVMWLGFLFISNIFQLSVIGEARFFGKLSTNGVTKREIGRLLHQQNRLLFLVGVFPALLIGYFFSAAVLPEILSGFTMAKIERSGNVLIFILSFFSSYLTVRFSERKSVRLAKNASPIEMKRYMGAYRRVKTADNGDCLKKIAVRQFKSDKRKVVKVWISVAVSILLANVFYGVTAGFSTEDYVKEELHADYILEKDTLISGAAVNASFYERITEGEIAGYRELSGIKGEGGGSKSHIALLPSEKVWDAFMNIMGENPYETSVEMWTNVYGLDDMLLQKLKPIRGTIDLEKFRTGNYVLMSPIYSDNNTQKEAVYEPGDQVTIPFESGEEGTYTVMAVVEELPRSLTFPTVWWSGSVYLPREEWREKEKRNDYYIYAFDVAEEYREIWDETLAENLGDQGNGLAYRSAKMVVTEAESYINGLKLAGFGLSLILFSMGILNFVNCMAQSVYSRSRELAVLESMGIEQMEIERNLSKEGVFYMAGGFVPGCILAALSVYMLICLVLQEPYITYHFYLRIDLLFAVLGCVAAVLVPITAYRMMNRKQKFLARIRSSRE